MFNILHVLVLEQRTEPFRDAVCHATDVATLYVEAQSVAFGAAEVKQLVCEIDEPRHVFVHDVEIFTHLAVGGFVLIGYYFFQRRLD